MSEKELLTSVELAERWSMGEKTLAKWRMEGRGPSYVKLDRRVYYAIDNIREYENQNIIKHEV